MENLLEILFTVLQKSKKKKKGGKDRDVPNRITRVDTRQSKLTVSSDARAKARRVENRQIGHTG